MPRPLNKIAADILTEWGPKARSLSAPPYMQFCLPYVDAMLELQSITDTYGLDDAEGIVLRFLTNAASWRGDKARQIKSELNAHLEERST